MTTNEGMSPVEGTTIERYRVETVIGAGSMGDVFRGVDVDLGRKVAIKILADKHRDNDELRARFLREARAVAAISHPNVVQVFTTGSYDDRPYIAMEFLDGIDLCTLVEERGPCGSADAARAVRDGARGLEAAAKAGLIHRDVKPSNLVLLHDGHVKVTDFGLAKPLDPGSEPALTALGVVVGTPDYIAPEQARGETMDERVDIYALGGTLYFLLTGVPPYRTGDPAEDKYLKVVARHLKKPVPDPRAKNPAVDSELAELAMLMMAKKPDDRPGYGALIEQLDSMIGRLEQGVAPAGQAPVKQSGRLPGRTAPTPYVGGSAPQAFASDDDRTPILDSGEHPDHELDEAAPTRVRIPSGGEAVLARPADEDDPALAPATQSGASRLLIGLTVLSALVFLTGLGLMLAGPMPASPVVATSDAALADGASDAARPDGPVDAPASPDAATSEPEVSAPPPLAVPEGMFLVSKPDGSPWFFAAKKPVTNAEYAAMFPNQKRPRKKLRGDRPVTAISYSYAETYARTQGKRLMSAEEWQVASRTRAFVVDKGLVEWIADDQPASSDPEPATRPVTSRKGAATRKASGGDDVTFRLAADLASP